ncbi:MAG: hypothetical protein IKO93_04480 [Lentisphaeria bacterium]|nr:hypothetical protein [Lentisphaeria bacterium]
MLKLPNAYILEANDPEKSFLVYGELNKTGSVAKGWRLYAPNLSHATGAQKNELCRNLQTYLSRFDQNKRVQFRFEKDSDYTDILDRYEEDTARLAHNKFIRQFREQHAKQFRREIERREIWREYLSVYVAKPAKDFIAGSLDVTSAKETAEFMNRVGNSFKMEELLLKSAFPFEVKALTAVELFKSYSNAVNCSQIGQRIDYGKLYNPNLAEIYQSDFGEQDLSSEQRAGTTTSERGYCLYGDGLYHNVLTLKNLPPFDLFPFYGNALLENTIINLSVSVNIRATDPVKTVEKLEQRQAAAQRDLEADPSAIAYRSEVDQLQKTIYRMGGGSDIPLETEYLIHLWNRDADQLKQDTEQIRLLATNLHMNFYMHDLTMQAAAQYLKTLPGNLYYKKWDPLFVLHQSFSALIPFNSTFVGCESAPQAIFHGDHHNIVCLNGFHGGTPQHAGCFGQSGAGKSVNTLGELLQTCIFYEKIVLLEEGASYLMFTRVTGGSYIEIDVNSNMVLNYFDTVGAPLDASQVEFAANFLTNMCGHSKDDEIVQDRTAMLSHYVNLAYQSSFQEWWNRHPERHNEVAKYAMTIEWMIPNQSAGRNTAADCFLDLKETLAKRPDLRNLTEKQIADYYEGITNAKITDYQVESPALLRDTAYAFMSPEDMPYHSQIVEMIRSTPDPTHKREETNRIATRLAQYMAESGRGGIFDGVTNVDLSNRIIHFEIGKMANATDNLKGMITMVISNLARNQIVNLPRKQLKMVVFEEVVRFLRFPGFPTFIKYCYAQLRKSNCRAVTNTQEAGQLMLSDGMGGTVGDIILGQSKQYYFLKNKDKENLTYFRRFANLSDDTAEAIMTFPSPEHIPGRRKYSSYVYYVDNGEFPITGIVRHYANELTLAIASTTGESFSLREEILRQLRIRYPRANEGELLLEYLSRQKLNNPALKLIQKMISEGKTNQLPELQEEILKLSRELAKFKGE